MTPASLPRVPNAPKTPQRTIRVDTALWQAAMQKAAAEGTTVTAILTAALKRYVRRKP